MKKSLLIAIILIIIILAAVFTFTRKNDATVIAPGTETTTGTDQSSTTDTSSTTTGSTSVKGTEQKTIAMGQGGMIAGITIRLTGLAQDSRCPSDVQCIQAGSVGIITTVSQGKISTEHQFISNAGAFSFQGYDLSIVNVTPVPNTKTGPIKFQDYRVTFKAVPTPKND